jgi:SpoVK/Ycf46/Vps4 family AAA+-type ATPase
LREAESTISSYKDQTRDFVGCEEVRDEILSSVEYWVLRDENFRRICHAPPPKIFIVKGSSGMGKSSLVHSVMVEAFERGKEIGIPVFSSVISPHKVYDKWLGESEKKIARAFDDAFSKPTIVFIDEAQNFVRSHSASESEAPDSGTQAYMGVQATLLEKVNELIFQDKRCILVLATNEFGAVLEAIRRRGSSGTIDLDSEIDRSVLVRIVEKNIEKYELKGIAAQDVLQIIEGKVRALGHGSVTPADVSNAFQIVIDRKTKEARSSYIRKLSSALTKEKQQSFQVNLEDFRQIRQLKEYSEDERSRDVRHIITRIRPKITLDDVGGLSGIKENLLKDIEVSLNQDLARKAGATPIRGVLLHGPPGCGKTWLAQAIAGELQATIYMIRGAQIIKPYHGQTEKIITDVFDEARKYAPSIIIIDELDALTLRRDLGGSLGAVTMLLSEMGGLKPLEGVVVIGTTNKLQLVDEAFLRAGRFDCVVEIPPPRNDGERKEIISVHLEHLKPFLDSSVSPDKILDLFEKRTFTPAKIERLISDAVELRVKELNALYKLSMAESDPLQTARLRKIYRDDLERLTANVGLSSADAGQSLPAPTALYRSVTPENYKLSLSHFKAAFILSSHGQIEEFQKIASSLRGPDPKPTVGKVYGLAALSTNGNGEGIPSDGTVAIIECVCNPYGTSGKSVVIGSEVAESVKASAEHARVFLNEQSDWAVRNYEFYLDFITFAKGLDTQVIQGPSAGAAMTLAQYSVAAKEEVLPNVVITGGVTPKGELVQVGGLDFKGMGKFVAALNTDGVDTIVIPQSNFDAINEDDKNFFERHGLKVVPARDFWQVAEIALASHRPREEALKRMLVLVQEFRAREKTVS